MVWMLQLELWCLCVGFDWIIYWSFRVCVVWVIILSELGLVGVSLVIEQMLVRILEFFGVFEKFLSVFVIWFCSLGDRLEDSVMLLFGIFLVIVNMMIFWLMFGVFLVMIVWVFQKLKLILVLLLQMVSMEVLFVVMGICWMLVLVLSFVFCSVRIGQMYLVGELGLSMVIFVFFILLMLLRLVGFFRVLVLLQNSILLCLIGLLLQYLFGLFVMNCVGQVMLLLCLVCSMIFVLYMLFVCYSCSDGRNLICVWFVFIVLMVVWQFFDMMLVILMLSFFVRQLVRGVVVLMSLFWFCEGMSVSMIDLGLVVGVVEFLGVVVLLEQLVSIMVSRVLIVMMFVVEEWKREVCMFIF